MSAVATDHLVTEVGQVCSNIVRFQRELARNSGLTEIMAYGRGWYACRQGNDWLLAPSKFAGYAENDAKTYLATYQDRDGRVTERVLSQWFEEVQPGTSIYDELHAELKKLFAGFGKTPNKSLRLNALKADLGAYERVGSKTQKRGTNAPRITVDPQICGGRPCIRGMRIRVSDILDLLAAGNSRASILSDYPYIEGEDIDAALEYASKAVSHRVIKAA